MSIGTHFLNRIANQEFKRTFHTDQKTLDKIGRRMSKQDYKTPEEEKAAKAFKLNYYFTCGMVIVLFITMFIILLLTTPKSEISKVENGQFFCDLTSQSFSIYDYPIGDTDCEGQTVYIIFDKNNKITNVLTHSGYTFLSFYGLLMSMPFVIIIFFTVLTIFKSLKISAPWFEWAKKRDNLLKFATEEEKENIL